jgi:hypothetical protein
MPDNQVTIKIVADTSELKTGAAEGATAIENLDSTFQRASSSGEGFDRSILHISSHMASELVPGSQRVVREIANMGATAIGVAPMLAAMVPIGIIAGAVILMEKLGAATLKDREAAATVAQATGELNDKILEEKERLVGLTSGPLAEAIQAAKDFAIEQNKIPAALKVADQYLDESRGHWRDWLIEAERVGALLLQGPFAGSQKDKALSLGGMTTDELKAEMTDITILYNKTKDYAGALTAIAALRVKAGDNKGERETLDVFEKQVQQLKDEAEIHQNVLNKRVGKEVVKVDDKSAEQRRMELMETYRLEGEALKANARLNEEANAQIDRLTVEQKDLKLKSWEEIVKAHNAAQKEMQDTEAAIGKSKALGGLDTRETDVKSKGGMGLISGASEIAQLRTIENEKTAVEQQAIVQRREAILADLSLTDDAQKNDLLQLDLALEEEKQRHEKVMQDLANKSVDQQKSAYNVFYNSLQSGMANVVKTSLVGGETMSRAFRQMWTDMVVQEAQFVTKTIIDHEMMYLKKIALARLSAAAEAASAKESNLIVEAWTFIQKLFSGKVAAAKAYAANAEFPPLAMSSAVTAEGITLSFQHGGVVPSTGMAQVHMGEMVLPAHISQFVQQAAAAPNAGGGRPMNFNYAPSVQAMDAEGVDKVLADHGDRFYKKMAGMLRNQGINV